MMPFDYLNSNLPSLVHNFELAAYGTAPSVKEAENLLPGCKSILSFAWTFENTSSNPTSTQGFIAKCARGTDYHIALNEKLKIIAEDITYHLGYECLVCVDNAVLNERKIAESAGVGWIGKNGNLFVDGFGSFVGLGEILIAGEIAPLNRKRLNSKCEDCRLCIDACPTNALDECSDKNLCLSYLTQKSGNIEENYSIKLANRIYGCDTCQTVCPINIEIQKYLKESEYIFPEIDFLSNITNEDFAKHIKHLAYGWIGKKKIRRNALNAAKNIKKQPNIS